METEIKGPLCRRHNKWCHDIQHNDTQHNDIQNDGTRRKGIVNTLHQWKRFNRKQITRWQHLSRLKASAFLFEIFLLGVKKYNNLYLRLVMPSSGR